MIAPRPSRPLLLALLLLAGCGGGSESTAGSAPYDAAVPAEEAVMEQSAVGSPAAPPAAPSPGAVASDTATAPIPRMIIRTGRAQLEVEALDPALAAVQAMATRLGGYVAGSSVRGGDQSVRSAELTVKIPAPRFDEAIAGLRPVGKVEEVGYEEQDVGEEFYDRTARLENDRRLEARLQELLATRTGTVAQVLEVERELARVRGEIESTQGRLRYLRTQVAVSTLHVTLHEPYPLAGDYPGSNPIVAAFGKAWRNFVEFVAWFIASLGVIIPGGILLFALWMLLRWLRRRFPRTPRAPRPPAATP